MNIRTATIAIAALTLLGLTACTPEEIAAAIERSDAQAVESMSASAGEVAVAELPTGPQLSYTVACTGITITTSGWPEGSGGVLGIGSEPPFGIVANESHFYRLALSSQAGYAWSILISNGSADPDHLEIGEVDCPGEFAGQGGGPQPAVPVDPDYTP